MLLLITPDKIFLKLAIDNKNVKNRMITISITQEYEHYQ